MQAEERNLAAVNFAAAELFSSQVSFQGRKSEETEGAHGERGVAHGGGSHGTESTKTNNKIINIKVHPLDK